MRNSHPGTTAELLAHGEESPSSICNPRNYLYCEPVVRKMQLEIFPILYYQKTGESHIRKGSLKEIV